MALSCDSKRKQKIGRAKELCKEYIIWRWAVRRQQPTTAWCDEAEAEAEVLFPPQNGLFSEHPKVMNSSHTTAFFLLFVLNTR